MALAAGLLSSQAQSNVYSANVVGYINIPLQEGFNLVANQLDLDGTGTNNNNVTAFTNNLPLHTQVFEWTGTAFNISTWNTNKTGTATNWSSVISANPGQGLWVSIPVGAFGGGTSNVTVVGNVLQGPQSNPNFLPAGGFVLLSSQEPLAGDLKTNLNYSANLHEQAYLWTGTGYGIYTYNTNKTGTATNWSPSVPVLGVGQGFWLNAAAGASWSNDFIVH